MNQFQSVEKYKAYTEKAVVMAGREPPYDREWVRRYRWALRIHGLTTTQNVDVHGPEYPEGTPYPSAPESWEKRDVFERVIWLNLDHREHRIACAAVRGKDGFVVAGYRHYDHCMQDMIRRMRDPDNFWHRPDEEQGFLDHLGIYRSREDAFIIALAAGQLENINPAVAYMLNGKRLHSEMLY